MAFDCKGYEKGCCHCPALRFSGERDLSFQGYQIKKEFIDKTHLGTVSASTWLHHQTKNCSLFSNKPNFKIMLPVEETIYQPGNKSAARKELGLPVESKIILCGAASMDVPHKGMKYLGEALRILAKKLKTDPQVKEKVFLLLTGRGGSDCLPFPSRKLGYLKSKEKLAQAYQAADLFVCPTVQDSGPMMINEAVLSGIPVVSFNMGVAADLIRTGDTGYLARLAESPDLARGMEYILKLDKKAWQEMSHQCRQLGLKRCGANQQIKKIIRIAEWMIDHMPDSDSAAL